MATVICDTCDRPLGTGPCPACRRAAATGRHQAPSVGPEAPDPPQAAERRQAPQARPVAGGRRRYDPPLTTRDCANWMSVDPEYIRDAIEEGRHTPAGQVVKLEAEVLHTGGRRVFRIYFDAFVRFLRAMGWKRIPRYEDFGQ